MSKTPDFFSFALFLLIYFVFAYAPVSERTHSVVIEDSCNEVFWSINSSGMIQEWHLLNDTIIGGDTLLVNSGDNSLSFGGSSCNPTFFTSNFFETEIEYYDEEEGWLKIPTENILINHGSYNNHQYFMRVYDNSAQYLDYYDGVNFSVIDSFTNHLADTAVSVADVAVDSFGNAWVFTGVSFLNTTKLSVYGPNGLIESYPISFESLHTYGSFFIGNDLYIGIGEQNSSYPNSIIPIEITGDTAQLGTAIYFRDNNFTDLAGCQLCDCTTTNTKEVDLSQSISVYPNPTNDLLWIESETTIVSVQLYAIDGTLLQTLEAKDVIDLGKYPSGTYLVKIATSEESLFRTIIKN